MARKPRGPGISGLAVAMMGTGALLIYAAIRAKSPLEVLRTLITGQRPEPLATTSMAEPLAGTSPIAPFGELATGTFGKVGKGEVVSTAGVKPHVLAQMQYIASTWGVRAVGMGPGSVPNSDHPKGLAIDAMVPGGAVGRGVGTAIATYYRINAARLRVKYIIWYNRIWEPGIGWHAYGGPNPHTNHVHISFYNIGSPMAR
jgi:hypothetical protein